MVPMTANQNSKCVALRGGRGDQPAVRTCPAMYPPPIAIAAAQSLAFFHQRAKMNVNVTATAAARATDGSICLSNCKSIGSRRLPLLLNAFHAQDDGDLVADLAWLEVHPEVASLDREARFAPAAHFAKHALAFATFLEVDGQRLGYAMYGEVTRNFESLPAAFDFCALEGHCRKLFRVEEIRTLQAPLAN